MKRLGIAALMSLSLFAVGCQSEMTYLNSGNEVRAAREVKKYYHSKNELKLDHAVEYDGKRSSYSILIFSYEAGKDIYISDVPLEFIEKHFPDEVNLKFD